MATKKNLAFGVRSLEFEPEMLTMDKTDLGFLQDGDMRDVADIHSLPNKNQKQNRRKIITFDININCHGLTDTKTKFN